MLLELSPAAKVMRPPAPLLPLPTITLTLPPVPETAAPVANTIAPLLPLLVVPELSINDPLTPVLPASDVCSVKVPLLVERP